MKSVLFIHALIAMVRAESLEDTALAAATDAIASPTSPVQTEDYMEMGMRAGLVQPTSSAVFNIPAATTAKDVTTSPEHWIPSPTSPTLNIMNHGAEGDLKGAAARNNLVYFGVGRHGFGFGAQCDDCGGCAEDHRREEYHHNRELQPCEEERNRHHERPCDHGLDHSRHGHNDCHQPNGYGHNEAPYGRPRYEEDHPPCDENRNANQPFLRVTPTLVVQDVTQTYTETATSTNYEVATEYATRTVVDTLLSTKTQVYHPVKTLTIVERKSAYEYPASTIDANRVRRPTPTPTPAAAAAPYRNC